MDDEAGVLAKIAAVFGRQNISIQEMVQKENEQEGKATLVLVTHETREFSLRSAVAKVASLEIATVDSVLRVVS